MFAETAAQHVADGTLLKNSVVLTRCTRPQAYVF
jgi:hypothetical protein